MCVLTNTLLFTVRKAHPNASTVDLFREVEVEGATEATDAPVATIGGSRLRLGSHSPNLHHRLPIAVFSCSRSSSIDHHSYPQTRHADTSDTLRKALHDPASPAPARGARARRRERESNPHYVNPQDPTRHDAGTSVWRAARLQAACIHLLRTDAYGRRVDQLVECAPLCC